MRRYVIDASLSTTTTCTSDHWNSSNFLFYPENNEQTLYIIDSYSENTITGFKIKHAGNGLVILHGSRDVGSNYGFGGIDDGTTVRFNTFVDNGTGIAVGISDPNQYTRGNILMEYNTVVNANRVYSHQGFYGEDGEVVLRNNVLVLDGAPGLDQSAPHFTWIWPWEAAPPSGLLESDGNCWFGAASDTGFRLGPAMWSFDEWQAQGFDVASVFADPEFVGDTYATGPASGCLDAGERIGSWE